MKAWELLSVEGAWTQGQYALTVDFRPTVSTDDDARSWCTFGAINKCYSNEEREGVIAKLMARVPNGLITAWNDKKGQTRGEVVAVLKELDI